MDDPKKHFYWQMSVPRAFIFLPLTKLYMHIYSDQKLETAQKSNLSPKECHRELALSIFHPKKVITSLAALTLIQEHL